MHSHAKCKGGKRKIAKYKVAQQTGVKCSKFAVKIVPHLQKRLTVVKANTASFIVHFLKPNHDKCHSTRNALQEEVSSSLSTLHMAVANVTCFPLMHAMLSGLLTLW